ncbi:FHA domain-containing protein [Sedimenticola thiotaurini]|uniref:FHA domain-containing protein n=1 Tax=Sedimenticola thiotaurini TaxID=1543721 RepID=A0A0F7JXX9_9GAMM|nr:FHA domain-containing protein [Sedimenticola thiotaurini]AKH19538.1 hypothetical protein AAY24_03290 [Sedimenticola thiotaurini]
MPKLTLCFKGRFIGLHNLGETSATIGRAADADIHIESLAIAERHALITLRENRCRITPIRDNKVLVNHRMITSPTPLSHGDVIQIGKHELFFSENSMELNRPTLKTNVHSLKPAPRQHDSANTAFDQLLNNLNTLPSGTIQILNGGHLGKIIPLQRGLTRLGLTGNECAVIAHRNDGYYISHLEGDEPPLVNKQSIANRCVQLHEGDEIQMGEIKMRFHEQIEQSAAI